MTAASHLGSCAALLLLLLLACHCAAPAWATSRCDGNAEAGKIVAALKSRGSYNTFLSVANSSGKRGNARLADVRGTDGGWISAMASLALWLVSSCGASFSASLSPNNVVKASRHSPRSLLL